MTSSIDANILPKGTKSQTCREETLERGTPAGPIYINISADLATNQTTADVKERNNPITNNTTAATWDYQCFACELVGV